MIWPRFLARELTAPADGEGMAWGAGGARMPYAPAVVERTMKVQQVLLQAISGQITWLQAEEICEMAPAHAAALATALPAVRL
jgi:hypothetical protein